jgi:purine-binding chemotaxis protein CheW
MTTTDSGRRGEPCSRWVCFELAGQHYGLPILDVQEVLTEGPIEEVPGATAEVLGVINLRGAIVTVLDLRRRLGLPERATDAHTRLIVVEQRGEPVALRVDRVTQVRALPDTLIQPAPPVSAPPALRPVRGIYQHRGEMLALLDGAVLLG